MDRITHIVDPHGDLVIVLKNPNEAFAVHDETDPKGRFPAPPPFALDVTNLP